ncbi:hypothetical protein TSOC_002091 [Tetrabaena socialis]|uniref:Uncharacterized protein n=1 Tax=Tetrabaena socialis TaxID=47790 RepID=A0A2J8AF06_9CHLO|nr:hypothetical protein TSOC_002091 [Tetrabaena socialis]|eukprot:PNH11107.1 hypothetical protein TSOC_002091 [Tetrabaena socialis]
MAVDGPVFSSYLEAYKANTASPGYSGSRASTEDYGAARRKSRNFVEGGSPLPNKAISVLHRPIKQASAKNAENLDRQHERDKDAFERRASSYRRLAQEKYHHNAPPGSILTTFEQGHIVDRGRGKSDVHEGRGVYDPVGHSFRVPPSAVSSRPDGRDDRPSSAPHGRGYASIHAAQPPQHERSTTPFEHKLLQASRGVYNPLTHEYKSAPEAQYVERKAKEFERAHGLGHGMSRSVQRPQRADPITGVSKPSPAPAAPSPAPASAAAAGTHAVAAPTSPGPASVASQQQRPTSAPNYMRKSMSGPSWGTRNPITGEWSVPPSDPKFVEQELLVDRRLGVSGQSAGRTQTPGRQGVYNPILNTWSVQPADPRVIAGLSFKPATLFSRPTAATIRM